MSRFTPHAPFPPLPLTERIANGRRTMLLIREPRPEARAAGSRAFYAKESRDSNPHIEGTAEWVSWDQGYAVEVEANS